MKLRLLMAAVVVALVAGFILLHQEESPDQSIACLTENIVRESKGQPLPGQQMVAYVTVARAKDNRRDWGRSTICGVVYAKNQFSWTHEKRKPIDAATWAKAEVIAREMIAHLAPPVPGLEKARYYLNPHTAERDQRCWFDKNLFSVGSVGNHTFYREPASKEEKQALAEKQPESCNKPVKKVPTPRMNPRRHAALEADQNSSRTGAA